MTQAGGAALLGQLMFDELAIGSLDQRKRLKARSRVGLALRLGGLLLLTLALAGCQPDVLNPQGEVGRGNATILINSVVIMLAIVVPTGVAALAFAWWFRSSNARAIHLPEFEYSGRVEMVTWSIPLLTIMLLGGVIWIGSHDLDPARPLVSKEAPLEVQVVSLDWKWLFIYPEQKVASVNRLVIPAARPVHFAITSASVMNAFFIPDLGSMIYAMNRMQTNLHLIADGPGQFMGLSAMFSGDGFADMHFNVNSVPPDQFKAWVDQTRSSGGKTLELGRLQGAVEAEQQGRPVRVLGHRAGPVPENPDPGPAPRAWTQARADSGRGFVAGLVRGEVTCWAN